MTPYLLHILYLDNYTESCSEMDFSLGRLLDVIGLFTVSDIPPHCRDILTECNTRLREFGQSRMEYLILAIVAMEKCGK